jgi:hypothetical protein
VLAGLAEYIIEKVEDPEQLDLVSDCVEAMKRRHIKVEHLQLNAVINLLIDDGVRVDIVLLVQQHARDFKAMWKGRRAAAEGLINVAKGGSTASYSRQQLGGNGGYMGGQQSAGFFDNY